MSSPTHRSAGATSPSKNGTGDGSARIHKFPEISDSPETYEVLFELAPKAMTNKKKKSDWCSFVLLPRTT